MSDPILRIPTRPSLEQLRKQAKELLRGCRFGDADALARLQVINPRLAEPTRLAELTLADAQFVIARDFGFESWAKLVHHIQDVQSAGRLEQYENLARDFTAAYQGDAAALQRLNDILPRTLNGEQLRELIHGRVNVPGSSDTFEFGLADAKLFVARRQGFETWAGLEESLSQPAGDPHSAALGMSTTPPFYTVDWASNTLEPKPLIAERDWNTIFSVMEEHRITGLRAAGQMTDEAMNRLSQLGFVTALDLSGSKRLSDEGLKHLAHMPQLRSLDIGGWETSISDRGLEVLRDLAELQNFKSCWTQGISDTGIAYLESCNNLESVNLMGTPTGDGAIRTLTGKPHLRHFRTGKLVTDEGLPLLHQFPVFKTWRGGEIKYGLMAFEAEPTDLMIDGPVTGKGVASLAGLEGLFGLSFFWHTLDLKPAGLAALTGLPNLGYLGCQGELCDDVAMRHISAIPRLRMLMAQGTVASDQGFEALSRSQTVEYIWGRECPNLTGRGFAALARMPSLKGLAVSCKNVDDAALSALPRFPALRGLMPMDVPDDGFRHIGDCENLEDLWCMYCRDTGDAATERIGGLTRLKKYYAGATKITDRSLAILARMPSLEDIEFHECARITDEGIGFLAGLPRLRKISVGASHNVTREGMTVFPATVRASYW